ncbi:MAG: sulfurtransferase TusA family protein [Candidatus Margulisiibacteriota bacterium]
MKTIELDITKDHCPMTFVKTKLKLETLDAGDELVVLLRAGEPLDNVPRTVTEQGDEVLGIDPVSEGVFRVRIRRLKAR